MQIDKVRFSATPWLLFVGSTILGIAIVRAATINTNASSTKIPYVPTRHDTVRDLLWMAEVGTNDVVYDLGSGDGRVVIAAARNFGARRAVGIEIDAQLVQGSRDQAALAHLTNRVQFIHGDLFTNDISEANVVALYLGQGANLDLRAQLVRTLKPGARVVSHQFGMGEWVPDKFYDVRTVTLGMYGEAHNEFRNNPDVPDYDRIGSRAMHDTLLLWTIPAPVAGVWRGVIPSDSGEEQLTLTLHQRLSGLTGTFQWHGTTNVEGVVMADLWGGHVRLHCIPTNSSVSYGKQLMWFDGRTEGNALNGTLWMSQGATTREISWRGRRTRPDFTGTWEWTGPQDSPVQLKIERRDGRLVAIYTDEKRSGRGTGQSKSVSITDLYDFGGGFYFTLLLGLDGTSFRHSSRASGPGNGWLVGEAVLVDDTLRGTIAFHPTTELSARFTMSAETPRENRLRDWQPKRLP